jgi:integrase
LKPRTENVRKEILEGGVMEEKKLNKTHVKFWAGKLFHPKSLSAANAFPNWYIQMASEGKQCQFSTGTPNKAEAARRAKEAYFLLKSQGWDAVWEKYGKKKRRKTEGWIKTTSGAKNVTEMTFGEYLELIEKQCSVSHETVYDYKARLRVLLASMFRIDHGNKKYDRFDKSNRKYEEEVLSVKIGDVTTDKIEAWKCEEYRKRVDNGRSEDSTATTINSIIRGCNNAFSRKTLKELGIGNGFTSPFSRIAKLREGSKRYFSKINAEELLRRAECELKESKPSQYAAIMLALLQGLRVNEIDKLRWSQIDWRNKTLTILKTKYIKPKTNNSCAIIPLNDHVFDALSKLWSNIDPREDDFVIEPEFVFKDGRLNRWRRCKALIDEVNAWLRNFGIGEQKPLHTLRKECGSMVYRQTGDIYAVALYLRDTLPVVVGHYADATVGKVPRLSLKIAGNV